MFDYKNIFLSRTVWANILGFAASLPGVGEYIGMADVEESTLQVTNLIAAISFIISTFFRIKATKQLLIKERVRPV